jgi:hypothetical protein
MILNLKNIDYQYRFDCEWENHTTCTCGDDYCRCSTIDEPRITDYSIVKLVDDIYETIHGDQTTIPAKRNKTIINILQGNLDVDKYFIYRILTINKAFGDEYMWEFNLSWGYYGQEMDSACIESHLADRIDEQVSQMVALTTIKEKMDYCLSLEYNGILTKDVIESKDFEVVEITIEDIDYKNLNDRHIDIIRNSTDYYHDYPDELPRGLVKKTPKGYHIIDGYHRIFSVKDKNKKFRVYKTK